VTLALKLLLAPGFIVATSLIGRRWGVRVAGVVAGLPAIGGPILLVVDLEHGRRFAQGAAIGTMLGVVGVTLFVLAYAASARAGWPVALAAGWAAFGATVPVMRHVHVGAVAAFAIATGACLAATALLPRHGPAAAPHLPPRWDLPLRACAALIPILAVTAAAASLGPHLTGVLAAFPVISPVLTTFTHAQRGPREAVRLLRGFTMGFVAYGLFGFVVALTVRPLGTAPSFLLALAAALAAQAALMTALVRRGRGLPRDAPASGLVRRRLRVLR
jgi:hypothetical protein